MTRKESSGVFLSNGTSGVARWIRLFFVVMMVVSLSDRAVALEKPRPGEVEYLKQTGQWDARLEAARALGNHLIDPDRLDRAIYRATREALIQQGLDPEDYLPAPPPGRGLLPTTGNVKIFTLLIDFNDYPGYSTQAQAHSALFGDGSGIPTNPVPYESMNNYYDRASYNLLDLSSGVTLGWYHAPYNRSAVAMTTTGRENLIKEAIAHFDASVDFSQFNNDTSDNKIEVFIVIWTGPNNGWGNFWWAYQTGWSDASYSVDGMSLGKYIWQWEGNYGAYGPLQPKVVIHEFGHGLGLPDYYDYDDSVGPDGGIGSLDMMHGNWGDHNSFSKWVLEWLTPTIVSTGSQALTLDPSGTSQDAVLIMPGAVGTNAFQEFFVAQNRYRVGNDPDTNSSQGSRYPTDGMLLWHVDARLNAAGTDYLYDNSYTVHKLLKLMEADGLERIEGEEATVDADMYYNPGTSLGPLTVPSSRNYLGVDSGVNVTGISQSWPQMSATFSIDDPRVLTTLTVNKAGVGIGTVTSDDGGISCGNDGQESYAEDTDVLLRAASAAGSHFSGWSGGGCSGTGDCVVSMTEDITVTATFTATVILDEDFDPESSSPPAGWTRLTNAGSAQWWFTYDSYNESGGTGECALGATYGTGPFDAELRTFSMDLSAYSSIGLEFKTSIGNSNSNADVDVSVNGASGPWTNVWTKAGRLDGPQTVNVDLTSAAAGQGNVMVRFHHTGTGVWWVLDDIKVTASTQTASDLVINEVMYDPAGAATEEWVEIYVKSGGDDLAGYDLWDQDGNTIIFPSLTPSTGDYILVTSASGTNQLSASPYVIYGGTGAIWDNTGDDVVLRDAGDNCLDYMAFDDGPGIDAPPTGGSWSNDNANPQSATGTSISLKLNGSDSDRASDWEASGTSTTRGPHSQGGSNDNPTAIELVEFEAAGILSGVRIAWETASEIDCAGYHLWRVEAGGEDYEQITDTMIPGEGGPFSGASYVYEDCGVLLGQIYKYKLEDIDFNGISTFHGPVEARAGLFGHVPVKKFGPHY